jgi:Rho-binding antiterminator
LFIIKHKRELKTLNKTQISCSLYDYIEIVCLYKYEIEIHTINEDIFSGIAIDTKLNNKKQECIVITSENIDKYIILSDIKDIKVLTKNAKFSEINFK